MNKSLKRILPILLGIVIIASIFWYLFVYDPDFTRDMLVKQARYFESQGNHTVAAWLYDKAYAHSGGDEQVAIELAEQFKEQGNFTQAEVTLSKAIADGGSVELYIALCKTYVEQDKLLDAVTMLDNIADEAIKAEIAALRPAAPTVAPDPGYYSQYLTVLISHEGGTLYVTTDGEYPSIADAPSDGAVTLVGGENTIYALAVAENGLVSPRSIFSYTVSGVIEEVTLTDRKIDAAVRQALEFGEEDTIYSSDLWTITALTLPEGADSYTDLSRLPYLQSLTIENSSAESLEGLSSLTSLTELHIFDSYIRTSDLLTVAALPNLQKLTLSGCGLSGIDNLSGAKNLNYLDLSNNSIRDFTALSFMAGLTYLDLGHNALTSLNAVSSLSALQTLNVSYNSLSSISPVAGCTQLKALNISNNTVSSLSGLESLTALANLDASYNSISDLSPVVGCTALTTLDVSSNALTDISCLSGLTGLQHLYFSRNQVSLLPGWSTDCALVTIDGSYNNLSAIGSLAGYENLNYVLMDYNNISAVNALAICPNLIKVSVYGNPVTDVSELKERSIIVNYNPLG